MANSKITDKQIETLSDEAAAAGDVEQVELCDKALSGDWRAREDCEAVIVEASSRALAATINPVTRR